MNPRRPTSEATASLGAALDELARRGVRVVAVRRSPYATSHLTYDIDVASRDGSPRRLVWKSLAPDDLLAEARSHRPDVGADVGREPYVYRSLLAGAGLGTAELVADRVDRHGHAWLLIERVEGRELYQFGDLEPWQRAARWLVELGRQRLGPESREHLVHYDETWFAMWPERAVAACAAGSAHDRRRLGDVLDGYERVIAGLAAQPRGLVHGEFYASNVLVDRATGRVCPVDWEMAGIGSPLLDLAALVSGSWNDDQRTTIALAYRDALPPDEQPDVERFLADLDVCRLHLCVQWLGWSAGWSPPAEAATDWLTCAHQITERRR